MTNIEIRAKARQTLQGNWGTTIGITLLLSVIANATGGGAYLFPFVGGIFSLFITSAVNLGTIIFSLNLLRSGRAEFMDGFKGFENIVKATGAVFVTGLFTFLWALLFIIPGIIKFFSYSQTLYIIADNPDILIMDAIDQSCQMMDGVKGKLFALYFSFIGWALLSVLTLGIGLLWLIPYMNTSLAAFYEDIKKVN